MTEPTMTPSGDDRSDGAVDDDTLVRLLLESTGEGIYGIDLEGRCTFANPACVRLLGFDSADELLGEVMHDLVHHTKSNGDPYPMTDCQIYRAFWEGRGVHVDDEVMWRRDGEQFCSEYWSYPMRREGELIGSVLTFIDITERREVQEQLRRAKALAEQASEAKSQFMANMSHELRTPMNAILGYSEMLMEDAEEAELEEMVADLTKINAAGRHLLELINAVLDLSKIEAGRMDLHIETFAVAPLLDEVVAVAEPLIVKNGNTFIKSWDESIGSIDSDMTKIRQALFNLLSNAAKFTSEGQVTLAVSRIAENGTERIRLAVSDTGLGIPADKLEHVFEEFAQAEDTTTRDFGGTGLGLSLTRRLCRLMGGEVTLESEPGEGSTFTIDLPCRSEGASRVRAQAQLTRSGPAGDRDVDGGRILVIDDDQHSRELLSRTLKTAGYDVVTTAAGMSGVELARKLQPALITLDILMPEVDGWTVLSELKAQDETRDIPVVMLSISPDEDKGYMLGAVESLTKPVDRELLKQVVHRYIEGGGGHVLIVDDDAGARSLLTRYAEAEGWEHSEADTGASALERLQEKTPDLILLDLMMPVMDGFEFVEQIQAREQYRHIPIVVVTSRSLTAEDQARLKGNVERVIEKGQNTADELLQYVRALTK